MSKEIETLILTRKEIHKLGIALEPWRERLGLSIDVFRDTKLRGIYTDAKLGV